MHPAGALAQALLAALRRVGGSTTRGALRGGRSRRAGRGGRRSSRSTAPRLSSSRSSSDSSASSRLSTSRSTSSSTLPLSRAPEHHVALGVQHLLAQPAVGARSGSRRRSGAPRRSHAASARLGPAPRAGRRPAGRRLGARAPPAGPGRPGSPRTAAAASCSASSAGSGPRQVEPRGPARAASCPGSAGCRPPRRTRRAPARPAAVSPPGGVKAAASVTTPRMPAHETRGAALQRHAVARIGGVPELVDAVAANTQTIRGQRWSRAGRPRRSGRAARRRRSTAPTSSSDVRHLQPDQQEDRVLQDEGDRCASWSARRAGRTRTAAAGDLCPSSSPAMTTASTPLACDRLGRQVGEERRDQRQRRVEHRVLDRACGSRGEHGGDGEPDQRRRRRRRRRSRTPTSSTVTIAAMAASVVRSATSAVASLSRLSPSRIVTIRRGMPDPARDRRSRPPRPAARRPRPARGRRPARCRG